MFSSSRKTNVQVAIADNVLTVAMVADGQPRIWRADLGKFIASALLVKERPDGFSLQMSGENLPRDEIGAFADKKNADQALQAITNALLEWRTPRPRAGGWFRRLVRFVFYTVVFIALLYAALIFVKIYQNRVAGVTVAPRQTEAPAVNSGVPTPADDLLGK